MECESVAINLNEWFELGEASPNNHRNRFGDLLHFDQLQLVNITLAKYSDNFNRCLVA